MKTPITNVRHLCLSKFLVMVDPPSAAALQGWDWYDIWLNAPGSTWKEGATWAAEHPGIAVTAGALIVGDIILGGPTG